jgi:hypothetical protein
MRTVLELLEVMNQNRHLFRDGLCHWALDLYGCDLIDSQEYFLLKTYIKDNKPSTFSSWNAFFGISAPFYWKKGDPEPRIQWLLRHIKKLEHEKYR